MNGIIVGNLNTKIRPELLSTGMDFVRWSAKCSELKKTIKQNGEIMNFKHTIMQFMETKVLQWFGHLKITN